MVFWVRSTSLLGAAALSSKAPVGCPGIAPSCRSLESSMTSDQRLLALIGKRLPAIFDVIPRGPRGLSLQDRVSAVALNPQPLPPGPPEHLGAALAQEFAHTAWVADRLGVNW